MTINNPRPSPDIENAEHENSLNAKRIIDVVGNSLVPSSYDYIDLSYSSSLLTGCTFKLGGSTGSAISTLLLGYDTSSNLISVAKI